MIELKDRGAWFGDPLLKERTVELMKRHREMDRFTQGLYQVDKDDKIGFKGCAVGCLVETSKLGWVNDTELVAFSGDTNRWHVAVETQFNIPAHVADSIDSLFEHQDNFQEAGAFAVAVVEAIPVGADLSGIVDGEHDCPDIDKICWQCETIGDWYDDTDRFIQALADAPLVAAARALILVG